MCVSRVIFVCVCVCVMMLMCQHAQREKGAGKLTRPSADDEIRSVQRTDASSTDESPSARRVVSFGNHT